ncbi:putative glycosyltransferase [Pseudooceanicola batsensis HTCC2597]|uniref:Putative glycosyltransferase n=1 Tax=Pseudooceanicola batsensis (strain ATCC BAA-863 / DSM 15984 / KCTC 12145 / HTCC2597) TaxID=252305 RepID=A3U2J4_PSEBH|nr:glycosyltransferase [Pseudooceanicola batsensis]EAQ01568.1 putative glycosyltransferase [Pseudooceanicola batsensis HTCC2597]
MTGAIVIPSYNRPRQLAACLETLAKLEGGPWRVIVVDDGSPEPLAPVCAAAPIEIECIRQKNAGPAAARNAGVAAADGADTILFTDDDCHPRPDWARRMVAAQDGVPMRLVGGRVVNAVTGNLYSAAAQSIQSYVYEAFGDFSGPFAFFSTNNLACRRVDFEAAGGFDTKFRFASEDRDFSRRWRDGGGEMSHVPDAVVDHHHRMGLRGFWRQNWSYGRGARRFHTKLAAGGGPEVSLASRDFYVGLLFHPLRRPSPRAAAITGLICAAQALQLGGYLSERRAERRAKP